MKMVNIGNKYLRCPLSAQCSIGPKLKIPLPFLAMLHICNKFLLKNIFHRKRHATPNRQTGLTRGTSKCQIHTHSAIMGEMSLQRLMADLGPLNLPQSTKF